MRKLSFEEKLRHRLEERLGDLSRLRGRNEPSSTEGILYFGIGAVAGLAAGMFLAQRYGGIGAITSRLRDRFGELDEDDGNVRARHGHDAHDYDYDEEDEQYEELTPLEELEERVLDAYHSDPILSERAIDIGAIDDGIVELTGWVRSVDEAAHAVTVARGTPGVETVVNRLSVRRDEALYENRAERYAAGDDSLTEGHWEGQQVGIGRSRQGTSADPDRHVDPKPELEERWMRESEAYKDAAGDMGGIAERRRRGKSPVSGDRDGGAPITPGGVPQADHVANPADAPPQSRDTGNTNAPRGD